MDKKEYKKQYNKKNKKKIAEYSKKWNKENREKKRGYQKKWAKSESGKNYYGEYIKNKYNNSPEFRKRSIERVYEWRKKNPEKYKSYNKSVKEKIYSISLIKKYGITIDRYNEVFDKQNGVCAICKKPTKKKLFVDHDHQTGKVRGLLCSGCNMGIGFYELYKNKYEEYLNSFL